MSDNFLQEFNDLRSRVEKLEGAFPKDEEGLLDYSTHKKFHKESKQAKEDFKKKRSDIIKSLVEWACIAAATILLSHLIPIDQSIISNIPK